MKWIDLDQDALRTAARILESHNKVHPDRSHLCAVNAVRAYLEAVREREARSPEPPSQINRSMQDALEPFMRFVDINDGDTLSRMSGDERVLATASGSWSGFFNLTLGHMRDLVAAARGRPRSKPPTLEQEAPAAIGAPHA